MSATQKKSIQDEFYNKIFILLKKNSSLHFLFNLLIFIISLKKNLGLIFIG